jgi:uncharacterized oxidoreductase
MQMDGNTILVTGGGGGIGLALAKRLAARGNHVIICGRNISKLEEAKRLIPGLVTLTCDVSSEKDRAELATRVTSDYPALNVLVNNAGIQNRPAPLLESQNWAETRTEIATNLDAPIHLTMLLLPQLSRQPRATILNVTSGLAHVTIPAMPIYCATKAALHSFTQSLRYQLKATAIGVVEIVPPSVNTDLGGRGLHTAGVDLDEFADHAMRMLEKGEPEFGYQFSEKARLASRAERDQMTAHLATLAIERPKAAR